MPELSYVPGKLYGSDRDPTLTMEGVRSLDDASFGKLCLAIGRTAAQYREAERQAHCPSLDFRDRSDEALEARSREHEKFTNHIRLVDESIGKVVISLINFANIDPNRMAMYDKTVVFKESDPVLYYENWGTEDLDDPGRDDYEIQAFIGLNSHLETEAGLVLVRNTLDVILDGSKMSPGNVPSSWETFGTVSEDVFKPFVREE